MVYHTLMETIYALLLQALPESLILTMAIFSLLRLRLGDRRIWIIALLQTATNLIQLLPIAFGMHTVILMIAVALYTSLFTRIRLSKIFLATLICFAIAATVEGLTSPPLLAMMRLKYEIAFANPLLRAFFSLPEEIVLLLLSWIMYNYNKKKGLLVD